MTDAAGETPMVDTPGMERGTGDGIFWIETGDFHDYQDAKAVADQRGGDGVCGVRDERIG
jgi:hypothetical protein